ncbi:MFS transporter [Streptomyces gamaensis]|uniref:MFS transporter n=1 Tax=Streptomyces gamaensis TaxID=1763542 RepID=A0ABW0YY33_9ACTN
MDYLLLLRRRPVLVLWLARSLSVLSDRVYALAVMWSVYTGTGSASLMGLVSATESLPYLLLGTGGRRLVARCASYRALAWVDGGRAAVAVALPLLWTPNTRGTAVLFTGILLLGVLGALFDPNLAALVPDLVEPGRVHQVTGLFDLTNRIARIAGRSGTGLLLLLVTKAQLFTLNGTAFAVSTAALAWLARRTTATTTCRTPAVDRTTAGPPRPRATGSPPAVRVRPLLRAHPQAGLAIALHALAAFGTAVSTVGLPALLATHHGAGAEVYGLVTAATGVGALLGNPLAAHRRPVNWLALYCGAWAIDGAATACMGLADHLPALALLSLLTGVVTPSAAISLRTYLATFPPQQRLRLLSLEYTATRAGSTTGILLLPLLVDLSPRGSFLSAGTLVTASALTALLLSSHLPTLTSHRRLPVADS